jgi:transcriptional regulator with GAF, ATPase, and Fis domain
LAIIAACVRYPGANAARHGRQAQRSTFGLEKLLREGGAPVTATSANTFVERDPHAGPDWAQFNLVGESQAFRQVLRLIQQWARVDATVLLCGETGTGKELAARAVHYLSERQRGPFVPVNCGAIPDSILEAELFGHAKGAFTDARHDSRGVVGLAQGGTLFLDEVDSLSARGQAAILRFVQDHSYRPVGAARFEQGDVRVVAATNGDLAAACRAGRFRQDLLYRLNLLTVNLPPLREREGDALLLARAFVTRFSRQYRSPLKRLDGASARRLQAPLPWPGNVRELEHLVHRSFLLAPGDTVDLGLPPLPGEPPDGPQPTSDAGSALRSFASGKLHAIAEFERGYLSEMLARAKGNLSLAARLAGKERSRFGRLVKKYGLQRAAFGDASVKAD